MGKPKIEIGDIFRRYGNIYREKYKGHISKEQHKAIRAIEQCRTAKLGGHIDICDKCNAIRISYNSCRNRHCPKCQSLPTEKWLLERQDDILPVQYYHIVLTLPSELKNLVYSNKQIFYNILFKSASQTLLELTKDSKYLGAQIGITSILHTWGQNLSFHPHLHCLVTGGGLTTDNKWVFTCHNYFLPVRVISKLFKGKFIHNVIYEYEKGNLKFSNAVKDLIIPYKFNKFIYKLRKKKWIVNCKPPFKNPNSVLEYFGRYTHRVAIANHRIIKVENDKVYFKWKDYSDNCKIKIMSLNALEFIRRFLFHILPHRFNKIRYYGLLSNCHRKVKIALCRTLLNNNKSANLNKQNKIKKLNWKDLYFKVTGNQINICPVCKKGRMILKEVISPYHNNSPPKWDYAA